VYRGTFGCGSITGMAMQKGIFDTVLKFKSTQNECFVSLFQTKILFFVDLIFDCLVVGF
jgi:hypothetical protein